MTNHAFIKVVALLLSIMLFSRGVYAQLQPPDLNCVGTLGNGDVQLDWSNPTNACAGVYTYTVWGSNSGIAGPYNIISVISNTLQTSFIHVGANGNTTTWNYYITAECDATVSATSDTIDNLDPVTPDINFVTVNNGLAEFNWSPGASPETYGYIIYLVVGSNYQPIDTVIGALDTTYLDLVNFPTSGSRSYTVAAIDSCFNTGVINTTPHSTIFVSATTQNCSGQGIASWSPYQNWVGGVTNYKLYASYNNAPPVLVDSTTALADTFDYTIDSVCLFVVATQVGTGYTSTSNVVCISGNPESPISDLYVHTATVLQQGINRVFYSVNPGSDVNEVFIERSEDSITYNSIDILPAPATTGIQTYDDETALTDSKSYYYRVKMKDNCNNEVFSNAVKTILLNGYAYSNYINSLTWDGFFHQLGPTVEYTLERNSAAGWQPLTLIDPLATLYEEDVQQLVADSGTLCYVVSAKAIVQLGATTDTVTSRSNELCLDELVKIGVPNAFAPEGGNSEFKPILRFTGNKSYQMQIYNRWGGLIFSTKSFDEGWDGTYKGSIVPMGAYAYFIEIVDNVGRRTERKGTVLVVR